MQSLGEAEPALRRRARRSLPSDVGRGGANPQPSGEAESSPQPSGEAESSPQPSDEAESSPWGSGEPEPIFRRSSKKCSSILV